VCCLPYAEEVDWTEIAVVVHIDELVDLKDILLSYTAQDIDAMLAKGHEVLIQYFTLSSISEYILETLRRVSRDMRRLWLEPSEPPSPLFKAAVCSQKASSMVILRLQQKFIEAPESVNTRELTAVGKILLRRCLAAVQLPHNLQHVPECQDTLFLLRQAVSIAHIDESRPYALSNLGLAELLIDGNSKKAQELFVAALEEMRELGEGLSGLEILHGVRSQEIRQVLVTGLSQDHPNLGHYDQLLQKESQKTVRDENQPHIRYCLLPLHKAKSRGERYVQLWHACLTCIPEGSRSSTKWVMVLPEEALEDVDEEQFELLLHVVGFEQFVVQTLESWMTNRKYSARMLWSSACVASGRGCYSEYDGFRLDWKGHSPVFPPRLAPQAMAQGLVFQVHESIRSVSATVSQFAGPVPFDLT